jgi:hypothetical protein
VFDEYEKYQSVVLRHIVLGKAGGVHLASYREDGRIATFILDRKIGLHIKHSTKRLSPWSFTFNSEHLHELQTLRRIHHTSFVAFVCGYDGWAALNVADLIPLLNFKETDQAWIRIARQRRSLYAVSGNGGELHYKISSGPAPIIEALDEK